MKIYFDDRYNRTEQQFDTLVKAVAVATDLVDFPVPGVELVSPEPATRDDLLLAHTEEYIDAVETGEPVSLAKSNGIGWDPGLFDATRFSTGGMIAAVREAIASGGVSGSLSSGLHHARADQGAGYCTFNGLAIAALRAVADGAQRVVVLDLDAHCGGGTASIIDGRRGVEQVDVSVIAFDVYNRTANASRKMADAYDYLEVVAGELDSIVDPAGISVLFYNAGMDPHEDARGVAGITTAMMAERERMVFEWARGHGVPVAFALAGGYTGAGADMQGVVDLHRLTIEAAAAVAG